ncbi:MAG TPA: 4Fe-4S binding protein [bacterium]|nr:4Fe-4S binding protein [bacterium]HOL47103.1 4Fe-4S binding protein [bacterium]HPQ18857.1 4Fe-4S binding protein [bacterium]
MAKRKIIKIDENLCNGCGLCIPNCPEGALQIIDGKVRLISDLFCDGLGACIGHCPVGAITIEEREAEKYDERKVMENIVKQGENVIKAHLEHLLEHNEHKLFKEAIEFLKEKGIKLPIEKKEVKEMRHNHFMSGCPGAQAMDFRSEQTSNETEQIRVKSQLRQWPVQLHLISPMAPYFQNADVLLVADCVAYALGDFHNSYLKGKSLAIACPKLDDGQEEYIEKITSLIDDAKINTLTVLIMQVPCCSGLLHLAQEAASKAKRKIPIKKIIVSLQGEILSEEWV